MPKKKDLTGLKYGRLTVVREGNGKRTSGGNKKVTWICICDCNPDKEVEVTSGALLSGKTKSCGCLNDEMIRKSKFKQQTTYDLSGEYGIGTTAKGDVFWFDLEDYPLLVNYNWFKHHKYFTAHVPMEKPRRTIMIHRLIMGLADEKYEFKIDVDHIITENKFDNRKSNLRIVTKQENNRNKVMQKNNTSGFSGVNFHKDRQAWRATIYLNKKIKQKDFKNFEDAVAWRIKMEDLYYGDTSYRASQALGRAQTRI